MGQWNTNSTAKLPTPETQDQKVLHLADYLASRKDINMEFGEEYFDEDAVFNDTSTVTTCEKEKESV